MRRVLAIIAGAVSVFFVFYTIRLLVVTGFLQRTRAGGGGAYIGAVAFPVLALLFGWAAFRLWRKPQRVTEPV
jgi:hypothetical protein